MSFGMFIEGALGAAGKICETIGGKVMEKVGKFAWKIMDHGPKLNLTLEVVKIIAKAIVAVAEIILDKPETELPEELAMKAEICAQKDQLGPEDFPDVQAYIEYLRKKIKLDQTKVDGLSEEMRQAYASVGLGLYVQAMEERYGMCMEPEFWRAAYKARVDPAQIPVLITTLKKAGVEQGTDLDAFLAGTMEAGSKQREMVVAALKDYIQETGADTTIADMRRSYLEGVMKQVAAGNDGRRLTIAICIRNRKMQGLWRDEEEGRDCPITVNGEDQDIPWSPELWKTIFSNLQINPGLDRYRVVLWGGGAEDLPALENTWEWTFEALSQAAAQEGPVDRWYINGTELKGAYAGLFPTVEKGMGRSCRLFTSPPLEPAPRVEGGPSPFELLPQVERGLRQIKPR